MRYIPLEQRQAHAARIRAELAKPIYQTPRQRAEHESRLVIEGCAWLLVCGVAFACLVCAIAMML